MNNCLDQFDGKLMGVKWEVSISDKNVKVDREDNF